MSITIGDALLWIRGRSDKLDADLKQAETKTKSWGDRIKGQLSDSINFAMGQIMSQGLNQLAAGIERMAKETIELGQTYAQQVEDMARLSGASVEDASRIIQVADDMRLSYSEVSTALKMYAKTQADNGRASKMSIDELASLSDQYLRLAPGVDRANFLLENFGRAGLEMGKLMEQGGTKIREMSAAVDENLILTKEDVEAQEKYRVAMDNLNDALAGVKIQIANLLAPYLEEFAIWLKDEGIPRLIEFIDWFKELPKPIQYTIFTLAGLLVLLVKLGPMLLGIYGIVSLLGGGGALAGLGTFITGTLIPALAGFAGAVATFILSPIGMLAIAIVGLIVIIKMFGKEAWAVFKGLVSLWIQIVVGGFKRMVYEIKAWLNRWIADFKVAVKFFYDIGKQIVDGIWRGIQSAWTGLKTNVTKAIDDLKKWVEEHLNIKSPSLVWAAEIGAPMAAGIGKGFSDELEKSVRSQVLVGIQGLQGATVGAAQTQVTVQGPIEYHGRFSQSELEYLDRRHERRAENLLLSSLEKMGGGR
jgi:hypothetical protein